jgi:hypothetical protein
MESEREARPVKDEIDLLLRLSDIHVSLERALGAMEKGRGQDLGLDPSGRRGPVLFDELAETVERLRREAAATAEYLSPAGRRSYEGLRRLKKLPFVARLRGGLCGECHVKLPSALAGAALSGAEVCTCPFCSRLLWSDVPVSSSLR